jgi:hypothetical protein
MSVMNGHVVTEISDHRYAGAPEISWFAHSFSNPYRPWKKYPQLKNKNKNAVRTYFQEVSETVVVSCSTIA